LTNNLDFGDFVARDMRKISFECTSLYGTQIINWPMLQGHSVRWPHRRSGKAMTQQLTIGQTDVATVAALPHPAALQEINIYSHSTLLYWWPGLGLRLCHRTSRRRAGKVPGHG
jgi:hypothetical protein